ncbi:diaminopropionate ammonia-lyase [Dongia mobilis]|uniref:Diaminopropionate ammonia-lyase n=1 Tax=Dongia mobilis TaxID=578943 RepID=A0A4R6WXE3_9PROT|nr:diaminopropionate ammonia-lyase [Dongia mobilis]TDQ86338.1 diaminopropionate ammonia-lyase [Dongia mobilis]
MNEWNPPPFRAECFINPNLAPAEADLAAVAPGVVDADGFARALAEIRSWPGYAPTPLVDLPGLARHLGLGGIHYKDEGGRFGLGAFKAVGGAYAVLRHLQDRLGNEASVADLIAGKYRDLTRDITVCTATDGNHGKSVAWGARLFGCRAVIYIHEGVSIGREQAIAAFGAEMRRIPDNYDASVRACAADAAANGWQVISDTTWEGYQEIPRHVMHGYGVMLREAMEQWPAGETLSHVFIQAGVGGLPAAVAGFLWLELDALRPKIIVVEPDKAACHFASARAGTPTAVTGKLDTLMAGLACGEVSPLAWELLDKAGFAFMKIPDAAAVFAMKSLAAGIDGDPRIVGGEAGVGGLAGLIVAANDQAMRDALLLDAASRVLIIGSEGATDPALYRQLVGMSPEDVLAGKAAA